MTGATKMTNLANNVVAISAAVQALSAIAVAVLTLYLVRATNKYVKTTERVLELDWSPDLRIANVHSHSPEGIVYLTIANLAKPAALVHHLKIGQGGRAKDKHPPQDVETYPMHILVSGGKIERHTIDEKLLSWAQKHNLTALQIGMNISVVYDCSGKQNESAWVDCDVRFAPNRTVTAPRLL